MTKDIKNLYDPKVLQKKQIIFKHEDSVSSVNNSTNFNEKNNENQDDDDFDEIFESDSSMYQFILIYF